jgi:predicted 3-demethylubiquinone-9 3-methyltransferase (glyoxalase superfamily)
MMQRIVANIWSNRNAEEMGAFYADALPDTEFEVEARYPEEGLLDFQQEFAGQALTVTVMVSGTKLTLVNAGDEFRPTPAISFMLNFDPARFGGSSPDAVASATINLDRTWDALTDGGVVRMELGEYPFAQRYGWVEDRYGVNWQLMLTDPEGEPRPFVVPALMFGGDAQDKAAEAADFYVGAPTGPASAEALAYGEFRVGDQWFMATDFGADHAFSFSEGVSLEVQCEDQAEIDRLWNALSAVSEAEQCGWLKDRYGVSWQIVPTDMAELMARPGAFEHMLEMKKLVIADF